MQFSLHALERFHERFPDCPLTIYEAFSGSVPFGRETTSTRARIHLEHGIIFIVDRSGDGEFVRTVLTKDLYLGNTQANARLASWTFPAREGPRVTVDLPLPEESREARRRELLAELEKAKAEKREQDRLLAEQAREQAGAFAMEKNHISWQPEFFQEVRERYGLSKRKQAEFFLPAYNHACSLHALFNPPGAEMAGHITESGQT